VLKAKPTTRIDMTLLHMKDNADRILVLLTSHIFSRFKHW